MTLTNVDHEQHHRTNCLDSFIHVKVGLMYAEWPAAAVAVAVAATFVGWVGFVRYTRRP